MKSFRRVGWENESHRHALAAKGIKTKAYTAKIQTFNIGQSVVDARRDRIEDRARIARTSEDTAKGIEKSRDTRVFKGVLSQAEKERARRISEETLLKPATRVILESREADKSLAVRLGLPETAFIDADSTGVGPSIDAFNLADGEEPKAGTESSSQAIVDLKRRLELVDADIQRIAIQRNASKGALREAEIQRNAALIEVIAEEQNTLKNANAAQLNKRTYVQQLIGELENGEGSYPEPGRSASAPRPAPRKKIIIHEKISNLSPVAQRAAAGVVYEMTGNDRKTFVNNTRGK